MDLSGCTVAFDLDGTLVETAGDLHRALNQVLTDEGLPPASLDDVRAFVGHGARVLIIRACAAHGVRHPEDKLDRLVETFVTVYAADIAALSAPYPGLIDTLGVLKSAGARLTVCTNKRTALSNQLLDALGMTHWFQAVVGADAVENRKPHPDHFIAAVRAGGGDPTRALMVGDSIYDVESAKAAGAPVAVASFGYSDTAPELLGADAVFTHYAELPSLAARLLHPGDQPRPRR